MIYLPNRRYKQAFIDSGTCDMLVKSSTSTFFISHGIPLEIPMEIPLEIPMENPMESPIHGSRSWRAPPPQWRAWPRRAPRPPRAAWRRRCWARRSRGETVLVGGGVGGGDGRDVVETWEVLSNFVFFFGQVLRNDLFWQILWNDASRRPCLSILWADLGE